MSTSYPAGLDTFTNPTGTDPLDSPDHAGQHADANDAIEAIEAELGLDPAGSEATVVARLDSLDTTIDGLLPLDGSSPMSADLDMGTNAIQNATGVEFPQVAANPGGTTAQTLWCDDGTDLLAGTLHWEEQLVVEGETSIGDPGFEQGSVPYVGGTFDAILKVNDFGGDRDALAIFHRHSTTDAANVVFTRSRTNDATHAALQDDDDVAWLLFAAHDGTDYNPVARISAEVDGTVDTDETPGRLVLSTTPAGSNATSDRLSIYNDGLVEISEQAIIGASALTDADTLFEIAAAGMQVDTNARVMSITGPSGDPVDIVTNTGLIFYGVQVGTIVNCTVNTAEVSGMYLAPFKAGTGVLTGQYGIRTEAYASQGNVTNQYGNNCSVGISYLAPAGTISTAAAMRAQVIHLGVAGTISTGIGLDVNGWASIGTVTTGIGIRVTGLVGTTKWGLQVDDYQSQHIGKLGLGGAAITTVPAYALDLQGTAQDRGVIGLAEQVAAPTDPTQDAQALIYVKDNKLIVSWDDSGTMKYRYLDLTSTDATWTYTTSAP